MVEYHSISSLDFPGAKKATTPYSVVDSHTKTDHFIPSRSRLFKTDFVQLVSGVKAHGVPRSIVSDRDTRFVSGFWRVFCQRLGIKRALSSSWRPQTAGQTERANRAIERVLRPSFRVEKRIGQHFSPHRNSPTTVPPIAPPAFPPSM